MQLTFWDIAAGILIGGGLIMGMVWGAKRGGGERPFFWICGLFACFIIVWRGYVWHTNDVTRQSLYEKYGLVSSDHQ